MTDDQGSISDQEVIKSVKVMGDILDHSYVEDIVHFAWFCHDVSILKWTNADSLDFRCTIPWRCVLNPHKVQVLSSHKELSDPEVVLFNYSGK